MKLKRMGWVGVFVLTAAAALWWVQRPQDQGAAYRTGQLERGSLQAFVSASGMVNPVQQVVVGTQVSGQVKELLADFNSVVKKGALIARIDPESFQYRLRQSQADLESAKATVLNAQANVGAVSAGLSRARLEFENAQRDLHRKQDLLAQQFISQTDFEAARNLAGTLGEGVKVAQSQVEVARAQVTSAKAAVRQREAALAQAQIDLERTEIRSPVEGIVIKRAVDVGQTVAASLQAPELFVIARNLSEMQVEASVDEADIAKVRLQQQVTFTVDGFPGRSFEGQVSQVRKSAVSQQNVVTYTVVVPFANTASHLDEPLLPGMTANVRILTDYRQSVLKVPNAALRVRIAGVEPVLEAPASSASSAAAVHDAEPMKQAAAKASQRSNTRGRLYTLGPDGKPRAFAVLLGVSDGISTEVLLPPEGPLAKELSEGTAVVLGVKQSSNNKPSAAPRGPF
jgi:HlyD family secretion protein